MTALPGWPAVSGAATFQHIRRALAGQVVKNTAGVLRKGILPINTTALVTGTATMNVAVGGFVAVLDRNGAIFLANDGAVNVLLSSAPASGSRWSVVYVKQRETEAPFSDSVAGPIIDKVESTTSEAAARALLPAGALELAVVQVNAGSSATNAVGVTITQTYPYTAMEGGSVLLRSQAEQDAWTPHDGSTVFRLDSEISYVRDSGEWVPYESPWIPFNPVWQATGSAPSVGNGVLIGRYRYAGRRTIEVRIALTWGSTTNGGTGYYTFAFPAELPLSHADGEQIVAAKAYTAGNNTWIGTALLPPASRGFQPFFPRSASVASVDRATNSTGGGTGQGIPQIPGSYTFETTGRNIIIQGFIEVQ